MRPEDFDQHIRETMGDFKVQPSRDFFDAIHQKHLDNTSRKPKHFPLIPIITALLLLSSWILFNPPTSSPITSSASEISPSSASSNRLPTSGDSPAAPLSHSPSNQKQSISNDPLISSHQTTPHADVATPSGSSLSNTSTSSISSSSTASVTSGSSTSTTSVSTAEITSKRGSTPKIRKRISKESALTRHGFQHQSNEQQSVSFPYLYFSYTLKPQALRMLPSTSSYGMNDYYMWDGADKLSEVKRKRPPLRGRTLSSSGNLLNNLEVNIHSGTWFNTVDKTDAYRETPLSMMGIQFRNRIEIKPHWMLLTGLGIQRRTAEFVNTKKLYSETMIIDTVVGYIIDPFGAPQRIERYDRVFVRIEEDLSETGRNTYTDLMLPVGLEYTYQMGRHRYFVNAGISFQYLITASGFWPHQQHSDLQPFNRKHIRPSGLLPLGTFGGVGYEYMLHSGLGLLFEGRYMGLPQWHLTPTSGRIHQVGVSCGLMWKF
jgi:hypothetical protein